MTSEEPTLRAGAAKIDITPADLTGLNPMGGSFTGVHDPIYLRALVLGDGTTEVALVSLDLIEAGDMTPVRQRIQRELGIPAEHVFITATHTHNAPRLGLVSPGALAHNGGPESLAYTEAVYDQMLAALATARENARPARFGVGTGHADVNVNRDEYAEGKWVLGRNEDGPSDKTVWVLKFETLTGEPIAVVANYSVHSTAAFGTWEVSGDLAGAATRYVEERLGGDAVALWTLGSVGDQAPRITPSEPIVWPWEEDAGAVRDHTPVYAAADAQGLIVGAEVVRVAAGLRDLASGVRLGAGERVVACPAKKGEDVMDDMVQEDVATVDLRLGLIRLGQVALAGVSGEVTTRIHERLRQASPLTRTVLLSMTNDRIGYLPEDEAYDRRTFEAKGSPIAQGYAAAAIVGNLVEMIGEC